MVSPATQRSPRARLALPAHPLGLLAVPGRQRPRLGVRGHNPEGWHVGTGLTVKSQAAVLRGIGNDGEICEMDLDPAVRSHVT
jgi:hypothetical protein